MKITNRKIVQALKKARKILAKPENWVKGSWRTVKDDGTECYCLSGALGLALTGDPYNLTTAFRDTLGWKGITAWNDAPTRTHKQVLARLDKAIAKLNIGPPAG